jgi:DNA-binding YbaB/EbfC family protein
MKANIPKGMGGGPGNMQAMLRQAQKMQEDMARTQQELEEKTYTATAGGGAVSATVDGKHQLTALTIQPEVVDPDDAEMLADLVMAAVNEAVRKAAKDAEDEMGKITGGMSLPGMF